MKLDSKLWSDTKESQSFQKIPIGPQICKIVDVEDIEEKEYLKIYFDIATGDFKDFFIKLYERTGEWPNQGVLIRSYKTTAYSMLKSFVVALEKSNSLFDFEKTGFDVEMFKNKQMVVNFGEEEIPYLNDDNTIKVVIKPREVRSIPSLKEGKIKLLDLKKLSDVERGKLNVVEKKVVLSSEELPF